MRRNFHSSDTCHKNELWRTIYIKRKFSSSHNGARELRRNTISFPSSGDLHPKISWYQRSFAFQTRHGLAYKKEKNPWTCLFPIREIAGRTGLEIILRADNGLTSILTRVKARPWYHANTNTCAVTALLFIYASRDINRGRGIRMIWPTACFHTEPEIVGISLRPSTSNSELSKVKPSPSHTVNRFDRLTLLFSFEYFSDMTCWG